MLITDPEMTNKENSSVADLSSKKHLSSLLFFFISVYSNFTIQYNIFEFNKLQWFILLVGGVSLWLIPFVIEKISNNLIIIAVFAILNMLLYLGYISSTARIVNTLYVFLSILNALLIPLLAVQAVEDATSSEMDLSSQKLSRRRNRVPVQRLFLVILMAALSGIPTGYLINSIIMAIVLFSLNLLSFGWFAYEHGSEYRAIRASYRRVESKDYKIDNSRLIPESENEFRTPASNSTEDLESAQSEVALDWKIVCTKTTFYGLVSKLPRLFYYCYYWCLLTVVLIYMYQLSCQFRYNKEEIKPAYLRVYPLLFTVVSYPVIEWKILPELKVHKTFHKLLLSTVCAVLSLIVATILESYRVTETYGTNFYWTNPFSNYRVSSCPTDLDTYCNNIPPNLNAVCPYPPMMSETLSVGWQSIQFLLLSFSISLTGSCFIDFCFYEFFPSSPFMSITLSTGLIRVLMSATILFQYYNADPSRVTHYLTFNLNEENIPILLIYASLFIGFFLLYLFIEYFPFQQYYIEWCGDFGQSNTDEATPFLSSAPPPPFNPVVTAAIVQPVQPEPVIPFQPLREYVPAFTHILTEKDEKYDVFLTHDWGTAATQFLNHRRVSAVNAKLSALGLKTWFDEERMEGWNVRDQMTRGISHAHCVIVFITERYASKINSANPADNCYYEFNFAVHRVSTHKMIPVVMEETMKDTRQWQGRLAAELANHLYVNMSDVIPKIVPESNSKKESDEALKPNTVNGIDEDDALEFDQKCKEIVDLVGSVLVKPLNDLTAEQTVLFFKSVGCLGIEEVLKEKQIVLTGNDLNNVETLEDLLSLDLNLPRIKVRTILEEILRCKNSGVRMSKLLRSVIG